MWLGIDWVSAPHTDAEIAALGDELAREQIRYVFAYTSYLQTKTVKFNPTYSYAAQFVTALKKTQPDLKVFAWLGLPMPSLGGAADLSDPAVRRQVATLSGSLVHQAGFDGVHLDPETVSSGDQGVIALLDETRQAIGLHAWLSVATEKIQPIFPDRVLVGKFIGWSSAYYRQVAQHADQIVVMSYDTTLRIDWLYRELVRFQVINITQAVNGTGVNVLLGVPTSEEVTDTHAPAVENLSNGLQGVLDGLNDLDAIPGLVSGVAIYPMWEMTPIKWVVYRRQWLAQP